MSVSLRQTRFDAGELAPQFHARIDDPRYAHGLRQATNWLPSTNGSLTSRTGTRLVQLVKDSTKPCRLISFVKSDSQAFVLEFGDFYIRFYTDDLGGMGQPGQPLVVMPAAFAPAASYLYGDTVTEGGIGYVCVYAGNAPITGAGNSPTGTPGFWYALTAVGIGWLYELPTLWAAASLKYLKYAQVGNVITLAMGDPSAPTVPYELVMVSYNVWRFWTLKFDPLDYSYAPSTMAFTVPDWEPTPKAYVRRDRVLGIAAHGEVGAEYVCINACKNVDPPNVTANGVSGFWVPLLSPARQPSKWEWVQTRVFRNSLTGQTWESRPSPVLALDTYVSTDCPMQFTLGSITPATDYFNTTLYWRIYRGNNGIWGWVADADAAATTYLDQGTAPDYAQQPPTGSIPYGTDTGCAAVGFYEQRRYLANSSSYPQKLWGSAVGNFYRWARPIPTTADNALEFQIASQQLEDIRSLIPMRVLLIFTGSGEWAMRGGSGGAVAYNSVDMKRLSKWGIGWVDPLIIGNGCTFITPKGRVRDIFPLYGLYSDVWDGSDLSLQAVHMFEGHQIVDWCLQRVPQPVVWMVRDDGALISMTYDRPIGKEPTLAFAKHTTGVAQAVQGVFVNSDVATSAAFESVCTIPSDPYEAVWAVVRRTLADGTTIRCIERFANRFNTDTWIATATGGSYNPGVRNVVDCFSDSSITYDGTVINGVTAQFPPDSACIGGEEIQLQLSGDWALRAMPSAQYPTNFTAGAYDLGTRPISIVLEPTGEAPVYCEVLTLDATWLCTVRLGSTLTLAQRAKFVDAASSDWAMADSYAQLAHMGSYPVDALDANGSRGVTVVADGDEIAVTLVSAGVYKLDAPAWSICIGLSYNCDLELLPAVHGQSELRNRFKAVKRIGFEAVSARELWVGQTFDRLLEWQQRQVSDSYGNVGFESGYYEEFVTGDWNKEGRACVRHRAPLSATVLSVLREMEIGGT